MRYAAAHKPVSEALDQFVQRKGGINACAARFSPPGARCGNQIEMFKKKMITGSSQTLGLESARYQICREYFFTSACGRNWAVQSMAITIRSSTPGS
jgi:hypothetical protein